MQVERKEKKLLRGWVLLTALMLALVGAASAVAWTGGARSVSLAEERKGHGTFTDYSDRKETKKLQGKGGATEEERAKDVSFVSAKGKKKTFTAAQLKDAKAKAMDKAAEARAKAEAKAREGNELKKDDIMGYDERLQVAIWQTYYGLPAITGRLTFYSSQGLGQCTATLVAPQWLLTAAHCVSEGGPVADGMFFEYFQYFPRQMGYEQFEEQMVEDVFVLNGWIYTADAAYDVALVKLSAPSPYWTGDVMWFPIADSEIIGQIAEMYGYPLDKDSGDWMWQSHDHIVHADPSFVYHTLDVEAGMSGAALMAHPYGANVIVGVQVEYSAWMGTNMAVRISHDVYAALQEIILSNP